MRWRGSLNEPGSVAFTSALVNGKPARILAGNVFEVDLQMAAGSNTVTVQATDVNGPWDNESMISVGRRSEASDAWSDQGRLSRTAALLRGCPDLVPRGVYAFDSFDEADAWMTRTMIVTHERLSRKTSSASAAR